jgi:glycosyltransferase involved in cell wall biosynthesis
LLTAQRQRLEPAPPLRILQVSKYDIGGGAEKVAWDLFHSYRARGCGSWLAVDVKRGDEPNVVPIPKLSRESLWSRLWLNLGEGLQPYEESSRAASRTLTVLRTLAHPLRELQHRFGLEDLYYPGTHRLLQLTPDKPNIIHCHNLHENYFDLRAIRRLSQQVPVLLTLHDAWLLSGHCAHSFECERWKFGCGQCPDLTIYPAISVDGTAYNWHRRKRIFAKSRLYVATPSRWLMHKVEQSMLYPAIAQARVIPYGIDLGVFQPASKQAMRKVLGLPQDGAMLLFTANGIRRHVFKDYKTLRTAIARIADQRQQHLLFIALGESGSTERIGKAEIRFVPFQKDPTRVARYYQAADLYVHCARADTFPNAVLEALACGTPVVATAVGGIPEQVKGLGLLGCESSAAHLNTYGVDEATGMLASAGDAETIATGVMRLLDDRTLRQRLGQNAAKDARKRFDLNTEVDSYLDWYRKVLTDSRKSPTASEHVT